jgi:hypothetical protein
MIDTFCQRVQVSIANQWIRFEYILHIKTLSELRIIGKLYVIRASCTLFGLNNLIFH